MKLKGIGIRGLAFRIGDYLRRCGVECVLSGGACVSIYTKNRYLSRDLDFVLLVSESKKAASEALADLGFRREGRHFRHPDTPFLVEFLLPPVSIGTAHVKKPAELRSGKFILRLLSPTDCVKDRLAAFYFWNDRQSLDQALLVAMSRPVDFHDLQRWSEAEGMKDKFAVFRRMLDARRGAKSS